MIKVGVVRRSGVRVLSMERFADGLQSLGAHQSVPLALEQIPGARTDGRGMFSGAADRFVAHPLRVRRRRSDVFHLVDHSDSHLLRMLPNGRSVVTCHDLLLLHDFGDVGVKRRWRARFRWTIAHLSRAAAVVCVSEATRNDVFRWCDVDRERVIVVPNGVDVGFRPPTAERRSAVRASLGLGDAHLILQVTSGSFYKNSPMAIAVLDELVRSGIDVQIIRVGSGLSETEQRDVDRLGLRSRVSVPGNIDERTLQGLYGAADVLLLPSFGEGFGWPALEAMASGLPIVMSEAPALLELAGGVALTAAAEDATGLAAQAARCLLDGAEAARLRDLGLQRASQYSWQRTLRGYADVYQQVCEAASA